MLSVAPMLTLAAAAGVESVVSGLDGLPLVGLTAPAILGLAVLMVLKGKIVSEKVYQDKCDEAERWRLAYEKERESRVASDKQTTELLEVVKTNHALVTGIFSNSEQIRQSGGTSVVVQDTKT